MTDVYCFAGRGPLDANPDNAQMQVVQRMVDQAVKKKLENWVPTENEKVCQHIRAQITATADPRNIKILTEALVDMASFMDKRGEKEYGPA